MREIEVRVVSLEEAERGTAEFWLDGQLFGFTRLEEGELVLTIGRATTAVRSRLMLAASMTPWPKRSACSNPIEEGRDYARHRRPATATLGWLGCP